MKGPPDEVGGSSAGGCWAVSQQQRFWGCPGRALQGDRKHIRDLAYFNLFLCVQRIVAVTRKHGLHCLVTFQILAKIIMAGLLLQDQAAAAVGMSCLNVMSGSSLRITDQVSNVFWYCCAVNLE